MLPPRPARPPSDTVEIILNLKDGRVISVNWPVVHGNPPRQIVLLTPPWTLTAIDEKGDLVASPIPQGSPLVRLVRSLVRADGVQTYKEG